MIVERSGNNTGASHVFPPARIPGMSRYTRMRLLGFALLCCWAGRSAATVLDPPVLRCASLDASTDAVQLTWGAPPDPTGEFLRYNIYQSPAIGGPYALVGNEPLYAAGGWTHASSGANAGPRYYYITTVSTSGMPNESAPSDTVATIFLQVTQSSPLGRAVLDWGLPHTPPLPGTSDSTAIFLEYPQGTWTFLDSVSNTTRHYTHVIDICDDSLTFRIGQPGSGCVSVSSLHGAVFHDVTPPTIPQIVTVSVDTVAGRTVVDWDPSPELDTDGYIVVLIDGGGNVVIDTIYGRLNTSYVWSSSDPGARAESYTIAAIDTCWHGVPAHPNTSAAGTPHTTVFATTTYDRCGATVTVQWSPYAGWPVQAYRLYVRENNGPSVLLAELSAGASSFVHPVHPFTTYCYVVQAIGSDPAHVSLSNVTCRNTAYPAMPQWNYIRVATVAGENVITVVDSVDMSVQAGRYRLERTTNGGDWQEVASVPGGGGPVDRPSPIRTWERACGATPTGCRWTTAAACMPSPATRATPCGWWRSRALMGRTTCVGTATSSGPGPCWAMRSSAVWTAAPTPCSG
ncbi:MAG: hypothetical protein QM724_07475 [Flavobacteriales bacterium]